MQLLALEDVTLTVGGLLCNATHVIPTFALHPLAGMPTYADVCMLTYADVC
jgi:hypothetical protein